MEKAHTFSKSAYEAFLSAVCARKVPTFTVRDSSQAQTHPHAIVLRHDVDLSLELALSVAELESEYNVTSTYFVLLRSPFYNALSPNSIAILQRITELGHEIGLHWDGRALPSASEDAMRILDHEAALLSAASRQPVLSVSQHFPTTGTRLHFDSTLKDTYSPEFQRDFIYVSDSSMAWRQRDLSSILEEPARYHLLLHPIWWANDASSRIEKLSHSKSIDVSQTNSRYSEFHDFIISCLSKRAELDASFIQSLQSKDS